MHRVLSIIQGLLLFFHIFIALSLLPSRTFTFFRFLLIFPVCPGVGEKVADCIALMGYGNLSAFPTDVWIKRTMEKLYFDGKKVKPRDIHEFAKDYWGPYAGYAQQYLFHNARTYREDKQKAEKGKSSAGQQA